MNFTGEFSVHDLNKYLTKSEILDLLHICDQALRCRDEEELGRLVSGLKQIVPFDGFSYGLGTKNKDVLYFVNIDYPLDYLERYLEKGYIYIDPVLKALIGERKVVNWHDIDRIYDRRPEGIVNHEAKTFGLTDGYTYGGYDPENIATFWFAGRYIERSKRSKAVIEFAVRALTRPLKEMYEKNKISVRETILSKKEIEVLNWLKEGKSTWDLSRILKISERTVKFHIDNIMKKLDAVNRTHAVAIALRDGLIPRD